MEEGLEAKPNRICVHCGAENNWQRGQCISCGRTEFFSKTSLKTARREGLTNILVSIVLTGINFYFLIRDRQRLFVDRWVPAFFLLLLVVALILLVNGIYKFRSGQNIFMWRYFLTAVGIVVCAWLFFFT